VKAAGRQTGVYYGRWLLRNQKPLPLAGERNRARCAVAARRREDLLANTIAANLQIRHAFFFRKRNCTRQRFLWYCACTFSSTVHTIVQYTIRSVYFCTRSRGARKSRSILVRPNKSAGPTSFRPHFTYTYIYIHIYIYFGISACSVPGPRPKQNPFSNFILYLFCSDFRKINGRIKFFKKCTSDVVPHGGRSS
jgi:hypothetical protein